MSIDDFRPGRRVFLSSATAAAIGFGVRPFGRSAEAFARRGTIQADAPAGHGMLLFGEKKAISRTCRCSACPFTATRCCSRRPSPKAAQTRKRPT